MGPTPLHWGPDGRSSTPVAAQLDEEAVKGDAGGGRRGKENLYTEGRLKFQMHSLRKDE